MGLRAGGYGLPTGELSHTKRLSAKTVTDSLGTQNLGSISYDAVTGPCQNYGPAQPDPVNTVIVHDPLNRSDHRGNATVVSLPGQGYTCNSYDAGGNVFRTEGPGNPGTQVKYGSDSNLSAPSNTSVINDSAASLSTFTYTPWLAVSSFTGPNGTTGSFRYDAYAQPSGATLTTGGQVNFVHYPGPSTIPSSYFPNHDSTNRFPWAELCYIDGHFTRKTLDGLGRVVKEERGPTVSNGMGAATSVVDTQYGPCACSPIGKMVRQSQPYAPGATIYWTTYTYDGMGRTLTVTGPDGQSATSMTYNATATGAAAPPASGNSTTTVDPKGKWKIVTTDVFGNVKQVTEPNPEPGCATSPYITSYTYDKTDRLKTVSMPRGGYTQTRTFQYDAVTFKLTSETHPETGQTQYSYTSGGHGEPLLLFKQDYKGQQTKIETADYDLYNRPTRVKFLAAGGAEDTCQRVTYKYDNYPAAAGLSGSAWGHKTTSQIGPGDNTASCAATVLGDGSRYNQTFMQAFGYTGPGQIALKRLIFSQIRTTSDGMQQTAPGGTWDTGYTYDDEGYQTSTVYPSGLTHTIGLDFQKRPYSLLASRPGQNFAGPIIDSVTYNAADQILKMSWPANAPFQGAGGRDYDATTYPAFTETHTYNEFNQVKQIQTQVGGAASGVDLNYEYGSGANNGQAVSVASALDANFNQTYSYDSLKRLTATTGAVNQTYTYDGWGNLKSKAGGSAFSVTVDPATNRPYGGGVCYDPNGNLVSLIQQCAPEYGYDIQNRLVRVAVSSNGMQDGGGHTDLSAEAYYYTSDNKRVSTVRPNGNTAQIIYIYGARNEIAAICTIQVFGQAPSCAPADLKFAGRVIRQNHLPVTADRLGSVIGGPNGPGFSFGNASPNYYLPYGEQWNQSKNLFPGNFNFATYFNDQSTGLNYADQRFYNNTSGFSRFMSADPYQNSGGAEDPGSWNKYSYSGSDPRNFLDPRGLTKCDANGNNCSDSVTVSGDGFTNGGGGNGSTPKNRIALPSEDGGGSPAPMGLESLRLLAQQLAASIRTTPGYTECQGLADFLGAAAFNNTTIGLEMALGLLTPSQSSSNAALIFTSSPAVNLYSGGANGFASQYQNTMDDGPNGNGDQVHHFAAFFQFGYSYGYTAGVAAAYAFEYGEGLFSGVNQGDIQLGIAAARIGADLKSGAINPSAVARRASELCAK